MPLLTPEHADPMKATVSTAMIRMASVVEFSIPQT